MNTGKRPRLPRYEYRRRWLLVYALAITGLAFASFGLSIVGDYGPARLLGYVVAGIGVVLLAWIAFTR